MRSGCRGFTLIEVLLATLIVAFIGVSLYATFVAGIKLDDRIKKEFVDLDESRIISEQLARDLGRAVSYDFRGSFVDKKSFFDNGNGLIFVIDDNGRLRWVRYSVVADQGGQVRSTQIGGTSKKNVAVANSFTTAASLKTLVRDEGGFVQLFASVSDPASSEKETSDLIPEKREVLTSRIANEGWKILYAPSFTAQGKIEWRSDWKEDFLPAAVRLNFSLSPQGQGKKEEPKDFKRDYILPAGGHNGT